ncbi:MAG: YceD family protein [Gammaproteobacteria bacterium]|nr:YceD family protein [Gammaproteobacteria bacterium]
MSSRLPVEIDPVKLVEKNTHLQGALKISEMQRLSDSLVDHSGFASVSLLFCQEGDVKTISGYAKATLVVECQRCLEPLRLAIDRNFKLGVVSSDMQAKQLPKHFEPLLLTDETTRLNELIEDELILSVPDIPVHDECHFRQRHGQQETQEEERETNPFAILANIKSKENE